MVSALEEFDDGPDLKLMRAEFAELEEQAMRQLSKFDV